MSFGHQWRLDYAVLGEQLRDCIRIPGDRTGVHVPLEDFLVRKGHFVQFISALIVDQAPARQEPAPGRSTLGRP
jgi:hypothetical protein